MKPGLQHSIVIEGTFLRMFKWVVPKESEVESKAGFCIDIGSFLMT